MAHEYFSSLHHRSDSNEVHLSKAALESCYLRYAEGGGPMHFSRSVNGCLALEYTQSVNTICEHHHQHLCPDFQDIGISGKTMTGNHERHPSTGVQFSDCVYFFLKVKKNRKPNI